ncbi:MAG: ABC transporter ATP-binding protein [Thermodesulfovibrionales bacterium]|nr:ABC transporter ATP-binding protein [Thermodesulfovibrionales bacterium]
METLIKVDNLKKSFFTPAGELRILRGIDLEIKKGEMVAIVGASGVGKSTFLHILGTLDRPTEGRVILDNTDLFSLSEKELFRIRNSQIGFVFQFHYLLPEFTALENILIPAIIYRSQNREFRGQKFDITPWYERALYLMKELGVHERRDHRPGELSGGEQQRVAVARALILEPRVVLADEPTGNLDTATGEELFELLVYLNKKRGITFVIVTHNRQLADRCSRILKMIDGRIFEERS